MQQVHISRGFPWFEATSASERINASYSKEHEDYEAKLLRLCASQLWHHDSYRALCPRPILVERHHLERVECIHDALTAAIVDIVQRWWADEAARFPQRMPLKPDEEAHLKWMEAQVLRGHLQGFADRLGSWRPDFLVADEKDNDENFRVTEINARFSFNGFVHEAYGQLAVDQTLRDAGAAPVDLASATSADEVFWGLFSLFRPDQPLHLLKGDEAGIDIFMFIDAAKRHLGIEPRLITPGDLRLLPDPETESGFKLYCKVDVSTPTSILSDDGELVEAVVQIGLELHQHELAAMSPAMLREVSLCCFNDLRTILLVHDKRMLGIIKQELPSLVGRNVLTSTQADTLDAGIVDSVLPGSPELAALLRASRASSTVKDDYILKPIRGGKGAGILFGDEMAQAEWLAALEGLQVAELRPGTTHVIQKRVVQRLYDMVLRPSDGRRRNPLVGTYHVANGKLLGLGTWRTSSSRIVAISGGGSALCSVVRGLEA